MNNKLFAFLVVVLLGAIVAASVWLVMSINKYHDMTATTLKPEETTAQESSNVPATTDTNTSPITTNNEIKTTSSKYILPSDTRELTEADLAGMDYDTLNKAYNEIFARHGHDFATATLKDYFKTQDWYTPLEGKKVDVSELSELENKNLNTIKARIDKIKS